MDKNLLQEECPNCGAIWGPGSEEWDWQQCDACGWPDNDDEEEWDEDEWDDDDERDDPNDSRNL